MGLTVGPPGNALTSKTMENDESKSSIHFSTVQSETSETSTLQYTQEPFTLFKPRVEKLCEIIWPPKKSICHFLLNSRGARWMCGPWLPAQAPPLVLPLIERVRGGDYNRITSITLPSAAGDRNRSRNLILRVPRWGQFQIDELLATMDYVRQNSTIPSAELVAKDSSKAYPLMSPFIIQERIPGSDLEHLWNDLDHSQRCTIAREIGGVVKNLLALEQAVAGRIIGPARDKGSRVGSRSPSRLLGRAIPIHRSKKLYTITPFDLKSAMGNLIEEPEQLSTSAEKLTQANPTIQDFFSTQIGRWRAVAIEEDFPLVGGTVALWDSMLKIVKDIDDLGLFTTKHYCLCHVDLFPRNIMADIRSDGSIQVTGILDWDEAVVAPKFVACEPPAWLWGFKASDLPANSFPIWPYEKPGAGDVPSTTENQTLKRIFEEYAGPEYLSLAYDEHFRISRCLFRIALFGLTSSEHYDAADRIIQDWTRLRQSFVQ